MEFFQKKVMRKIEYIKKYPLEENDLKTLEILTNIFEDSLKKCKEINDLSIKKEILRSESKKFKKFKKKIELKFLSKFSPIIAFQIKYKLKNKLIIDLFDKYSYLTPELISKKLKEKKLFPVYKYNEEKFEDLNINIFEIPFSTLLISSIKFLEKKAPKNLNPLKLDVFVKKIYKSYNFIPYHNFTHAACVMQFFNLFLNSSTDLRNILDKDKQFITFLACMVHDNSHPGKNNDYYIKKKHDLAYNTFNKSVLENFHIIKTLKLLDKEKYSLFDYQNKEENLKTRKLLIETIISTDMKFHFSNLERLKTINLKKIEDKDLNFILGTIMHACDIGNPFLKFDLYKEQASLVVQEFHDQTISEENNGLEVTKFFIFKDLDGFYNSQKGFIDIFVIPLYKEICTQLDINLYERIIQNKKIIEERLLVKELKPTRC